MKAEHRKELQTNTLADNLGRLIQGSRSMSRRTVLIIVAIAVLGLGFWFWRGIQAGNITTRAELFLDLDLGNVRELQQISESSAGTEPGKLMQYQVSWYLLWRAGIEQLAANPVQARGNLQMVQREYLSLAEQMESDKVLAAEARYAAALIEESLAATESTVPERAKRLNDAIELYDKLGKESQETARGKQAAARASYLEKNKTEVLAFYEQMSGRDLSALIRQMQLQNPRVPEPPPVPAPETKTPPKK
jgi:hypothetical protein